MVRWRCKLAIVGAGLLILGQVAGYRHRKLPSDDEITNNAFFQPCKVAMFRKPIPVRESSLVITGDVALIRNVLIEPLCLLIPGEPALS